MTKQNRDAYHHGSLREALLDLALERIRKKGWQGFSMREAARDIGVSPGAAYRHFKTLDQLLYEVSGQGFALLDEKMLEMRKQAADGREELIGVGKAYIRFAREEPHLFNLMFSEKVNGLHSEIEPQTCASTDCDQLMGALHNFLAPVTEAEKRLYGDFFWVIAHGIAALEATTGWRRSEQEVETLLEIGISTLVLHLSDKS